MMIDAVMYGMIPRKKTETAVSAPPENRLKRPSTPPAPFDCDCSSWTALKSTYGTGMCEPDPEDEDDEDREQDLVPQVGDPEHVLEARKP